MLSPSSSSKSRKRNSQLSSMRSLRSSTSGFVRIWEAIWGNPLLESLEISLDPKKQLPWNLHLRQSRFLEACFMFPVSEMVWKWEINPHILPHLSVIFIYKSCIYIHTNNVRLYIYSLPLTPQLQRSLHRYNLREHPSIYQYQLSIISSISDHFRMNRLFGYSTCDFCCCTRTNSKNNVHICENAPQQKNVRGIHGWSWNVPSWSWILKEPGNPAFHVSVPSFRGFLHGQITILYSLSEKDHAINV